MRDSSPKSQPQLKPEIPSPQVETAFVDPCIVYLETTLPGEIPLLYVCWAGSSREVQKPGFRTNLRLTNVRSFRWQPMQLGKRWVHREGKLKWLFTLTYLEELRVSSAGEKFLIKPEPSRDLSDSPLEFKGAIRFISQETDRALQRIEVTTHWNMLSDKLLAYADLDWLSIADTRTSLPHRQKSVPAPQQAAPKRARKSLLRQIFSSVFKRKNKPKLVST